MMNMKKLSWVFGMGLFAALVKFGPAWADCMGCAKLTADLTPLDVQQAKYADLLKANREALAKLPEDATSKRVKIQSNVIILVAKLETLENQKIKINEQKTALNCNACGS